MHVVQGLIDAHVHMLIGGSSLQQIDLRGIASKADFMAAVQNAAGGLAVLCSILHSVLLHRGNTKFLFCFVFFWGKTVFVANHSVHCAIATLWT